LLFVVPVRLESLTYILLASNNIMQPAVSASIIVAKFRTRAARRPA
jgi:hypothetical protein